MTILYAKQISIQSSHQLLLGTAEKCNRSLFTEAVTVKATLVSSHVFRNFSKIVDITGLNGLETNGKSKLE